MLTGLAETPPELLIITALLPLTALMLVTQVNPYHALVMRGILGAVAALVYALFGAADVALTEALVGTMLSITLYAVAVRSSMSFRLGVLEADEREANLLSITPLQQNESGQDELGREKSGLATLIQALREGLQRHQLRLELVTYPSVLALEEAIATKAVHAIYQPKQHQLYVRLPRLYELLQSELPAELIRL